nr:RNA-directed DNA polymerase, eukaryota [Tanacetum cinerariifolium]
MNLMKQLHDIKSTEACDFVQKAKVKWAIEGDENSKFFHGIVNRKRANLAIKGIMVDGDWVDTPSRVKDKFVSHFASRFQSPCLNRSRINFTFPNRLNSDQVASLEMPIDSDEIRSAVWACGENKLPGLMASPSSFFVNFEILSLVLDGLISEVQSAFLPNRQILHGPFIINEILSWCKQKRHQAMIFKVDFAKAYDSVRWDFLEEVLIAFGFGPKWCSWILGNLKFGKASILVNGSPTSEFQFHCGLKQGLKLNNSVTISHLFYADDAVFVGDWKFFTRACDNEEKFFTRACDNEEKISWVKWSKVLSPKKHGGLGVSSFYALNRALLFKWVWRFISQGKSLWARVISSIHGSNLQDHALSHASPWSSIIRECLAHPARLGCCSSNVKLKAGLPHNVSNRTTPNAYTSDFLSSSVDRRSAHKEDHCERICSSLLSSHDKCCRVFSLVEIKLATRDFDDALVVGKGGFGKVYKGKFNFWEGVVVAIKRSNLNSNQGTSELSAEIEMLSKFLHSHIVSPLGYYEDSSAREMILVYEYMPNESLHHFAQKKS